MSSDVDKINIGDKVNVYFTSAVALFSAKVLHVPSTTGDCWHLKTTIEKLVSGLHVGEKVITEKIDTIHYVQIFERMDRVAE